MKLLEEHNDRRNLEKDYMDCCMEVEHIQNQNLASLMKSTKHRRRYNQLKNRLSIFQRIHQQTSNLLHLKQLGHHTYIQNPFPKIEKLDMRQVCILQELL